GWICGSHNSVTGSAVCALDCSCRSRSTEPAREARISISRSLDGNGRTRPGHFVTYLVRRANLAARFRLRGLRLWVYRLDDGDDRGLRRWLVRSVCESSVDQRFFIFSRNPACDCVCGISRSWHRESDTGADNHWMGGVCAPGARASAQSERIRIHSGSAVTGRLPHAPHEETPASQHSSTSVNSGHDWN